MRDHHGFSESDGGEPRFSPTVVSAGKRAAVGYEDGTVRVWDLKHGNAIHVVKGTVDGFPVDPQSSPVYDVVGVTETPPPHR